MYNIWTTADNKKIPILSLEHQHASNIHWFLKLFWKQENSEVERLLKNRWDGAILPYKPVWDWEVRQLRNLGHIEGFSSFIQLNNEVIGFVYYPGLRSS